MFTKKEIIYLPKHTHIPPQDSPQCYFFSFLHLRAMHGIQTEISPCVRDIVQACRDADEGVDFKSIVYSTMVSYADDLIGHSNEIIDEEGENYDGDWINPFLDKYSVDFAIARLLDLPVTTFDDLNMDIDNLTTTQLNNILENYGPIAIRLTHGNNLPDKKLPVSEKIKTANGLIEKNVYSVEKYQEKIPHTVLLIGVKDQPTQRVYFIDPNYPEMVLSMGFKLFKKNMLMPEFVHIHSNTLKPDEVIFTNAKHRQREKSNLVDHPKKRHKENPVNESSSTGTNATDPSEISSNNLQQNLMSSNFLLFNRVQTVSLGPQELGHAKLPSKGK